MGFNLGFKGLKPILPVPYSVSLLELYSFCAENIQIISHIQDQCACRDVTDYCLLGYHVA